MPVCWHWLALAGIASANESIRFQANARVFIDEDGVPSRVEPNASLGEDIRRLVERKVLRWRFEPAVVDGKPRAGSTFVFLTGCAVPREGNGYDIAMVYSHNGPGLAGGVLRSQPPSYPPAAARGGNEGSFRVVIDIDVDGSARMKSIEAIKGNARPFREMLRTWAASQAYVPEEVDGAPVATTISAKVSFWLPPAGETGRNADGPLTCEKIFEGAEEDWTIALNSPFRPISTE